MSSLRELIAAYRTVLVLDACSSRVQVGCYRTGLAEKWAQSTAEAGIGIFECVANLEVDLADVDAFVFCEGPGSILGIRTVAMAIRAWNTLQVRPVFTYRSLTLVAEAMQERETSVIADARRELWHHFRLGGVLNRVSAAELSGRIVMPEGFRHWSALPAGVSMVPYDVATLLRRAETANLFQPTSAPDAFLHEEPSYVTWTPAIHRAPSS
jgi:tRNA threonylcarbamoyladenosine biosynthesis protein TsaB